MTWLTKLTEARTDLGLLFTIWWTLLSIYINVTFGIQTEGCRSGSFPCYEDCCMKQDWFCDHKEERCRKCDVWKPLCGNDSVPLGCQLYCYKQQHLDNGCGMKMDNNSVPWSTFVAAVGSVGALAALLGIVLIIMVTLCVRARRKPQEQWPTLLRAALGLNRSRTIFKDGRDETNLKPTEEDTPMLQQQSPNTKDVDANSQDTNYKKPSSASLTSQVSSDCPSATTDDFNVTRVDNEDSDSQGLAADHQDDPPPAMSSGTNNTGANPGPGPCEDIEVGSRGRASTPTHPGTNPSSPQQSPRPRPDQPGPGQVVNNPDFSRMNPTNDIGCPQPCVVDPGTTNPVRNYDIHLAPVQPTEQ